MYMTEGGGAEKKAGARLMQAVAMPRIQGKDWAGEGERG